MNRVVAFKNKLFVIIASLFFGSGILAIAIGWVSEQYARIGMSAEIIERDYDGTVCFMCFPFAVVIGFVSFAIGFFFLVIWGLLSLIPETHYK